MRIGILMFALLSSYVSLADACKNTLERCNSGYIRVKDTSEEGCFDCKAVKLPYITDDGQVWLGPMTVEGLTTYHSCDVLDNSIKYLGTQPVCLKEVKCSVYHPTSFNDTREETHHFNCAGGATEESCSKKSWQKCLIDTNFENIDSKKCFKEKSGELPAGCSLEAAKAKSKNNDSESDESEDVAKPAASKAKHVADLSTANFQMVIDPDDVSALDAAGNSITKDPNVFAIKLQRALEKLEFKAIVIPYYKLKPEGRPFDVSLKNCSIKEKASGDCPTGSIARNIHESYGADKYKVCVPDGKSSSSVSKEPGQK
jgi:hypothetical protein